MPRSVSILEVDNGFAVWDGSCSLIERQAPRWVFPTAADLCAFLAKHLAPAKATGTLASLTSAFCGSAKAFCQATDHELDVRPGRIRDARLGDPPSGAAYDSPPQQPTATDGSA